MKTRPALFLSLIFLFSSLCHSQLLEINDAQLANYRGQAAPIFNQQKESSLNQTPLVNSAQANLLPFANSQQKFSSGITLDINLQMYIAEIRWVDVDGAGPSGTQGSVSLNNFYVGGGTHSNPSPVSIRGITLDVAGKNGVLIGAEKIGGPLY